MGPQDEMVSPEAAQQLHDLVASAAKQLAWYDGGHSLPVAYVPDAVAWLRTHLREPAARPAGG